MKRFLGLTLATGLWLGMASAADAQLALSIGNPYAGGFGYGGGMYGNSLGLGVLPGTAIYSSGYSGIYPGVAAYSPVYPTVYPRTYAVPAYGYRPYGYAPYRYGGFGGYRGGYGGYRGGFGGFR